MAPNLTSPSPLDTILGGDGADGALTEWAVGVVSSLIRSYTRLTITPVEDITLVLAGTNSTRLVLGERPLRSVASVTLDGVHLDVREFKPLRSGVLVRRAGWGGPDVEVTVVADIGFEQVPEDVAAVVETAAARLIGAGFAQGDGERGVSDQRCNWPGLTGLTPGGVWPGRTDSDRGAGQADGIGAGGVAG